MTTNRPFALTTLSEDEELFAREVGKFAETKIKPLVHEMDESEVLNSQLLSQLFEMGLMGVEVPEKYGGSGGTFFMAVQAVEELSKVDPSVGVICDVQNTLINNIFLKWANEQQRAHYFPRLVSREVGSYCLTEANSGSDAFAMKARAYDEGAHWRLEGKKIFITNAKEATIFVVFANVNPEAGYKGITAFIVEKSFPGLSIGIKKPNLESAPRQLAK